MGELRCVVCLIAVLMTSGSVFGITADTKAGDTTKWEKYIPSISGELKARYEWNTNGKISRFNVRNARLRFNGYVTDNLWYRFFFDVNDNGGFALLDTYLVYSPGAFEFILGQQRVDLDRSVNPYFFANRSFLIKYLPTNCAVSYDNSVNLDLQGWRDIGVYAGYTFRKQSDFPVKVALGVFDGAGMRRPIFTDRLTFVGRLDLGKCKGGLHAYAWYYDGWMAPLDRTLLDSDNMGYTESHRQQTRMSAAGLYYYGKRLYLEGEYGARFLSDEDPIGKTMHIIYLQAFYSFPIQMGIVRYLAPAVRWDFAKGMPYKNLESLKYEMFIGNRMTFGFNFGLSERIMVSEFRINYEKFLFSKGKPSDLKTNPLLQDKLTLELCIQF